jgi:cyclase
MLKIRIVPTLLYKDHGLVKGVAFDSWRRVGTALPAIKVYSTREVDELIFLDIAATPEDRMVDFEEIDHLADECFMPLTVGGGVRSAEDFRRLLRAGADKVSVNTGALVNPDLVNEASDLFGTQCVILSMDVKKVTGDRYEVYSHCGTRPTGRHPVEWARETADRGAGEILLTSIDLDGTMEGYDLELTRRVAEAVSIPVIASGGAGNYQHMLEALRDGHASAVAAASIFHFTQQTPLEAKRYLSGQGIAVRL